MAYTSDSEFNAETRVQKTNEIRPVDMYEGVHSVLKNNIWKWLLGWSDVTTDLTYDPELPPEDENSPSKIVNGQVAPEYGEKTKTIWSPYSNSYFTKNLDNQVRMEIDGTLLPEHDLFLHEIYRYLSCLYPDHPDWVELLTHNEVVDAFENAAAMVDYKPDDKFFMLAAQNMEKVPNLEKATDKEYFEVRREELKLLLRNLTNNSTRRKFYGSSDGLKMFSKGVGELTSCFPVGEYLPISPITKAETKDLNPMALTTDIFDPNFKRPFRVIDWEGKSRGIPETEQNITHFNGYSYPGHEKSIIELHDINETNTELTSVKSNISYNTILHFPKYKSGICYIEDIPTPGKKVYTSLSPQLDDCTKNISETSVFEYFTTKKLPINYSTLYSYKEYPKSLDLTKNTSSWPIALSNSWPTSPITDINKKYDILTTHPELNEILLRSIYNDAPYTKVQYSMDAYNNTLVLEPKETLKLYGEAPIYIKKDKVWVLKEDETIIPKDFIIQENNILASEAISDINNFAVSKMTGATKGILTINCKNAYEKGDIPPISFGEFGGDNLNNPDYKSHFDKYGIIINTLDNKKIAIEGSMKIKWVNDGVFIQPQVVTFFIEDVPTLKSETLCRYLYDNIYGLSWDEISEEEKLEFRKNRELFDTNLSYIDQDDTETFYNTFNFEKKSKVDCFYRYKVSQSFENKPPILEATKADGIPNEGNIFEIDPGHISIVGYFDIDGANKVNTFNRRNQYLSPESLSGEELLAKYYDLAEVKVKTKISISKPAETHYSYIVLPKQSLLDLGNDDNTNLNLISKVQWGTFTKDLLLEEGSNITAEVPTLSKLQIFAIREDIITEENDEDAYTLNFIGDTALRQFDTLSTGDRVESNGLPPETYIIKKDKTSIKLNHRIPKGGGNFYTFYCACEAYPTSVTEDFLNYKVQLNNYGSLSSISPWDNGLWGSNEWPHVSKAFIDGLVDPQDFKPSNTGGINFSIVVKAIYDKKHTEENLLVPSTVTLGNMIFYEANINKLLSVPNRIDQKNTLMNVEWLDYLENNLYDTTQASEATNVGTNLIMQTDMTGFYSLIENASYTDEDLRLKFQTFNYSVDTIPCFAQVGTGGKGFEKYFKLPTETLKPNVYGAAFFDTERPNIAQEEEELEKNGGRQKRRFVYSDGDPAAQEDSLNLTSVENPLFEVPLGEYDIQKRFKPNKGKNPYLDTDTISVSINKQVYKDLTKKLPENRIQILNESYTSFKVVEDEKFVYLGEWKPNVIKNSWNYPSWDDENLDISSTYYYTIFSEASGYINGQLSNIPGTSALVHFYKNGQWNTRIFNYISGGITFTMQSKNAGYKAFYKKEIVNNEEMYIGLYATLADRPVAFFDTEDFKKEFGEQAEDLDFINKVNAVIHAYYAVNNKHIIGEKYSSIEMKKVLDDMYDTFYDEKSSNIPIVAFSSLLNKQGPAHLNYYVLSFFGKTKGELPDIIKMSPSLFTSSIQFKNDTIKEEISVFVSGNPQAYSRDPSLEQMEDNERFKEIEILSELEIIKNHQNKFNLPRTFVSDGSYNIELTLDPQFISEGTLYIDGKPDFNSPEAVKNFNISQSKIYYDDENNCFYTTADIYIKNEDGSFIKDESFLEPQKIALKFKEQRFFKDVKYLTCAYKVDEEIKEKESGSKQVAKLTGVKGESFDISRLSPSDRVLEAKEVELKSIYSPNLEPTLYSRYTNLKGELYGITPEGDVLISNYRTGDGSTSVEKSTFAAEVKKYAPTYISEGKTELLVKEPNYEYIDSGAITAPTLSVVEIKRPLGQADIIQEMDKEAENEVLNFKYFKNYLVFEGSIDLSMPNGVVSPGNDEVFEKVLGKLSVGDKVIEAVPLESTSLQNRKSIIISDADLQQQPEFVRYKNGKLAIATFELLKGVHIFEKAIPSLSSISTISSFDRIIDIIDTDQYSKGLQNFEINEDGGYTVVTLSSGNTPKVFEVSPSGQSSSKFDEATHYEGDPEEDILIPIMRAGQPESGAPRIFGGPYDIVKAKDISMTNCILEEQTRELYYLTSDTKNPPTYYTERELKNKAVLIKTSILSEGTVIPDSPELSQVIETVKVANITEGPYVEEKMGDGGWYTSNGDKEAYIRGEGHCFVKTLTEYNDSSEVITTSLPHWKYSKIPSMLDTLKVKLEASSVEDIESRGTKALNLYLEFLRDFKETEDLKMTQLQKFHKSLFWKQGEKSLEAQKAIYSFEEFRSLAKDSEGNYKMDSLHQVPLQLQDNLWIVNPSAEKKYKFEEDMAGTPLHEYSYREYIYDWIRYVVGGTDSEPGDFILSSNISDTKIVNDILYIRLSNNQVIFYDLNKATSSAALSKDENWKVLALPMSTMFPGKSTLNEIDKKMEGTPAEVHWLENGVVNTDSQHIECDLLPIFNFDTWYSRGDTLIFGGSLLSLNDIADRMGVSREEAKIDDFKEFCDENKQLPAIFYTEGDGTFKMINIKPLFEKDPIFSSGSTNISVDSICEHKGKLYVSFKAESTVFEKKLQITFDENGILINNTLDTEKPILVILPQSKTLFIGSKTIKVDGGEITTYNEKHHGIIHETDENINNYTFDYTYTNSIAFEKTPQIASIGKKEAKFTSRLQVPTGTTGIKKFLFAVRTKQPITNQFEYLDYSHGIDYLGENGKLKVSTQEVVQGPTEADKVYSFRDVAVNLDPENKSGYTSVEEDINHKFYSYDKEGNLILLTNVRNGNIYLCDNEGKLLVSAGEKAKNRTYSSFISIEKWIGESNSEYTFVNAGIPKISNTKDVSNNMNYLGNDDEFNKFFDGKISFKSYNYEVTDMAIGRNNIPYIIIKNNKITDDFRNTYLMELDKVTFDEYVKNYQKDEEKLDRVNHVLAYTDKVMNGENELAKLTIRYIEGTIKFIVENEGDWGTTYNAFNKWYHRITCKDYNNKYFLFDNLSESFMLKNIRYISAKAKVLYKSGVIADIININTSNPMKITGNIIDMGSAHQPINGIYYPLNGYGGNRENLEIGEWSEDNLPWQKDPQAFTSENLKNSINEDVYLYNSSGTVITDKSGKPIVSKVPSKSTFKSILNDFGSLIYTNNNVERNLEDFIVFSKINQDTEQISLVSPLDDNLVIGQKTGKDFNDLKVHYFVLKILAVADTPAEDIVKNNKESYVEVSKKDIDKFPPNRVYFDPLGLPSPVVPGDKVIGGIIGKAYREENNYAFYNKKYLNKSSIPIYQCNENGEYIGYELKEGKLIEKALTEISSDILFNPNLPVYNTCEDWFMNEFYLKGFESNPFWQVIKVYPEFNKTLKKFVSKSKVFEYTKASANMILTEPKKDQIYIEMKKTSLRKINNGQVEITKNASYIDLVPGEIYFILSQPENNTFREQENFVKFGISYTNSFNEKNGLHRNIWASKFDDTHGKGIINLPSELKVSYTINTNEDFSDPDNKDAGITRISEFALFDQNHKMVAYSTFPPIEYRSDTQHISFTCFINYNPCIDYQVKKIN